MMDIEVTKLKWIKIKFSFAFLSFCIILKCIVISASQSSCDKTREVFNGTTYGRISHGDYFNYSQVRIYKICKILPNLIEKFQDSHCEWLIKADNDSQFITLKFSTFKTECSYDYVSCDTLNLTNICEF